MTATDFVDDDLIQTRKMEEDANKSIGAQSVQSSPSIAPASFMQKKDEINGQVATKLNELERLRSKLENLEREKNALEQMRTNQEKYLAGKREMLDHLEQSLVELEREQLQLNQKLEVLAETEKRFRSMLAELRSFNEEQWPSDSEGLRDQLNKALVVIENIRKEYNKAIARIEAFKEAQPSEKASPNFLTEQAISGLPQMQQKSFMELLQIGIAVTLPLLIMLGILIGVLIFRM